MNTDFEAVLDEDTAEHVTPRWAPLTLVAFVALVACSNAAAGTWAKLVESSPETLLALSSRNRFLALAIGAGVSTPAYAIIATLRVGLAFAVCHLIGRAYGDKVFHWFRRYLGITEKQLTTFTDAFARSEVVLVPLFVGSNLVAAISGVHRADPKRLAKLFLIGMAGRLTLMWWIAHRYMSELKRFIAWTGRYDKWLLVGSIVLVVVGNLRNFVGGRT